jgi:hypothetical protein
VTRSLEFGAWSLEFGQVECGFLAKPPPTALSNRVGTRCGAFPIIPPQTHASMDRFNHECPLTPPTTAQSLPLQPPTSGFPHP